jgi:hypothetical protein
MYRTKPRLKQWMDVYAIKKDLLAIAPGDRRVLLYVGAVENSVLGGGTLIKIQSEPYTSTGQAACKGY